MRALLSLGLILVLCAAKRAPQPVIPQLPGQAIPASPVIPGAIVDPPVGIPALGAQNAAQKPVSAASQLQDVAGKWHKGVQKLVEGPTAVPPAPEKVRPMPRGKLQRIAAHIFDVDDNIFLRLPTKIILFHKETGAEMPLSTEEYAKVRENLPEGYERTHESFREFRDPPGGNNFLKAVKWAVENLDEKEWQGPSWKQFVKALSTKATARHVGILTARNHRVESFVEAFEYLKEKGYIENIPALDLTRPVGDAPNNDTAGAKVRVMAEVLDRVQATSVGRKAKAVLDADGRQKRRIHSVGFSDDDRANFEKMATELAAAMREDPKRWNKIKIVLFYTGPGRKYSIVLTSHGGRRAHRVTERNEY